MGNKSLATRRKRETICISSDDSGISVEGGRDLTNTLLSESPEKNSKMPKIIDTSISINDQHKAMAENIRVTLQNIPSQTDKDPKGVSLVNFCNGPVGGNDFSPYPKGQFSFDVEEGFLDYEPDDSTAASDKNNADNHHINDKSIESFEETNDDMHLANSNKEISKECSEEAMSDCTDDEDLVYYQDEGDENDISENNDFLKNANVKFNGTNITIMRPFSSTVITNVPKSSNQERTIPSNEQLQEKLEKSQNHLNPPITPIPSPNISKQTEEMHSGDRVRSDMNLEYNNKKLTSEERSIFSYNARPNQQQDDDSPSDTSEQGADCRSCTSVLDLSDDQAQEILDNNSVYSEASSLAPSKASANFQQYINSKKTNSIYATNEHSMKISNISQVVLTPPSIIEEDISRRSNFSQFNEYNPALGSDKQELVKRWLNSSDISMKHLMESLCEAYFTSNCENFQCGETHLRQHQIAERIKKLPFSKVTEMYVHSQGKVYLYIGLFSTFLDCFKTIPNMGRVFLINMINDIFAVFNGSFIDKTVYVQKIVAALQDTGLSFKNAIDRIISKYGTTQITLNDILLFIVSKEPNLDMHWCIVQQLIMNRTEKLDHEVVTNLLNAALNYPQNKELWTAILNDIVRRNLAVWEKIPNALLNEIHMVIPIDDLFHHSCSPFDSNNTRSELSVHRRHEYDKWSELSALCANSTQIQGSSSSSNNGDLDSEYNDHPNVTQDLNKTYSRNSQSGSSSSSDSSADNDLPHLFKRPYKRNAQDMSTAFQQKSINSNHSDQDCDNVMFNCTNNLYSKKNADDVFKVPTDYRARKQKRFRSMASGSSETSTDKQSESAYSERVLNRIIENRNPPPRPQTPANIVAHPTRRPLIGSNYQCNISLHNLSPSNIGGIEISQADLLRLKGALDVVNVAEFLEIFSIYQSSYAIQNFVVHTLTLLKNQNHKIDIFKQYVSLQAGLEKIKPNYMEDDDLKMLIEVLAMNLVYLLGKKGKWDLCRKILLGMKEKDWHSLVTSKIFFCKKRVMSHMSRYIFLINIFICAKDFHWANEIFQCNVLKLLEPTSKWPFQYVRSDVEARNKVLQSFLTEGFSSNFIVVNDLLKHIAIVTKGTIEGMDIWTLFDKRICDMINSEQKYKSMLRLLCEDIIRYYGCFISDYTLQGYLLYMQDTISERDAYQLYKNCCDRGVYSKYTGHEYVITVGTKMNDFEINLLLKQYLENISNGSVSPHDFCIELKLSEANSELIGPEILRSRSDRNAFSLLAGIINILKVKFNIYIKTTNEMKIYVSRQMLESLLWK